MANYSINHILRPGVLERINPELLLSFLVRHEEALNSSGITLPQEATQESIPYGALLDFFSNLQPDSNPGLADALFYVNEISANDGFDKLLEACEAHGVEVAEESTPEDLAIQLWLHDPAVLERLHSEALVYSCQRFDFYRPDEAPENAFTMPVQSTLDQIASDLDDWFDRKKRGRGSRVFCYENDGLFRFLVLHGEPYTRVPVFNDGESEALHYRPAKYDVLIYNPVTWEMGVNTRSKGLRQEYLSVFGDRLFGADDHFPPALKYSLLPLHERGQESLALGRFSEFFEWVKLRELHVDLGGIYNACDIHRADDVLADFELRRREVPGRGLVRAKFAVKFIGEKNPRLITVQPPLTSRMTRESDVSVLEAWLLQQGFIVSNPQTSSAPSDVRIAEGS